MWVKLTNLFKGDPHYKLHNDKSLIKIEIADKLFKLRKNPQFKDVTLLQDELRRLGEEEVATVRQKVEASFHSE